jgi:hypothetical protein
METRDGRTTEETMNRNQEPLPWVDAQSDAPESLRRALGAAGQGPTQEELAQLARATDAAIAGGGAGGAGVVTKGASGGLSIAGGAGLAKVLALVAGVALAGAVWMGRGPASPSAPTRSPIDGRPAVVGSPGGAPIPAIVPDKALSEEVRARSPDRTAVAPLTGTVRTAPLGSPATAPSAGVSDELALLSQVRGLLAIRPDRALALARDHEARFPQGKLAQERDALIVQALRRLGLAAEARQADETFRARYPDSLYNRAIETPSAEHH